MNTLKFALAGILILSGCSSKKGSKDLRRGQEPAGRFTIPIEPKDREEFQRIRKAQSDEKVKRQVEFLTSRGHDIQWFLNPVINVQQHQTVQVIYFDFKNTVLAWCSGALLANGTVATAGHCNDGILSSEVISSADQGIDCHGKVLFAYKKSPSAPIQYYGCDSLRVQKYVSDWKMNYKNEDSGEVYDRWDVKDYALFTIYDSPHEKHPEFDNLKLALEYGRSEFGKNKYFSGWETLGVAIDPPQDGNRYTSRLKLILGETIEEQKYFRKRCLTHDTMLIRGKVNFSRPGNSGSPVYTRYDSSKILLTEPLSTGESDWTYLAPLYGRLWYDFREGRSEAMVYSQPDVFVEEFRKIIN